MENYEIERLMLEHGLDDLPEERKRRLRDAIISTYRTGFLRGWNGCSTAFNVGAHIVAERDTSG